MDKAMNRKLRWKKNPRETGLRAIGAAPPSSKLHDGTTEYASVNAYRQGYSVVGWYWVSFAQGSVPRKNTCNAPKPTIEEAKAEALTFIKSHLEQQP